MRIDTRLCLSEIDMYKKKGGKNVICCRPLKTTYISEQAVL